MVREHVAEAYGLPARSDPWVSFGADVATGPVVLGPPAVGSSG